MRDKEMFSTWGKAEDMQSAFNRTSDAYSENYPVQRARAFIDSTSYIDVEPNRSIRSSMSREDYYRFRPGEKIPNKQKRAIKMCMDAYDRVGIIRNVIDLMGDFACQGISVVHPNKTIERFYKAWFKKVNGIERSERFLNYLYRTGNVIVKRSTAYIDPNKEAELKKVIAAADLKIEEIPYKNREIPWQYDFLNPLMVDVENYRGGLFTGEPKYVLNISQSTSTYFAGNNGEVSKLPQSLQMIMKNGKRQIPLDKNKIEVFNYKKDDWLLWANPMIYAILDDLIMLEKMKLADLAALDGAISQIRLWRIGSLEHKLIPKKDIINKVRDILASNTGGGTMDLVWGPELDFKESQSQVYKFLGSEKYQPVLTSIYAGLGVPSTLTGSGGNGGYSNNYVSLKTLIERLEYGRQLLTQFWQKEIEIIQKAMGFRLPAQIRFDGIILSDESAEKQLLINLADRDIISHETILERFGELPEIEKTRVKREEQDRRDNNIVPRKASPYHNPNIRADIAKILVTKDGLKDDFYKDLDLQKQKFPPTGAAGLPNAKKPTPKPAGGRPTNTKDTVKRKTKNVKPKSSSASTVLWAYNAQKAIAEIVTPMILDYRNRKDVRSLTKGEFSHLEMLKFCILANIEPFIEITNDVIHELIQEMKSPSVAFTTEIDREIDSFVYINKRKPVVEEMKIIYATVYAKQLEETDEDIQD